MADNRICEEIVTTFLLNTCKPHPFKNFESLLAWVHCNIITTKYLSVEDEVDLIPLTTGSTAEFYIQPMLSCVSDFDVMYHRSDELAIPAGYPLPTKLPAVFDSRVKVYEIVDSGFSGYVYLMSSYLLRECTEDGKYNAVKSQHRYLSHSRVLTAAGCKANKYIRIRTWSSRPVPLEFRLGGSSYSVDVVYCLRCLSWPPQAANWLTRQRNCGWPDTTTVDRIVNDGCDVVPVPHRLCRQHGLLSRIQWRLSFSRAEIVLLNSWTQSQQIVYHLLRVFLKTERLTGNAGNSKAGTLSNYHVKTLMLWACELKPRNWWIDDVNTVRICVELIHTLAVWLTDVRCQHYFINCNLFDHPDSSYCTEVTAEKLKSLTTERFCDWFINSYMRRCVQLCPDDVSRLLEDVGTNGKLQNAVSAVVDWRLNMSLLLTWAQVSVTHYNIAGFVYFKSVCVRSCSCLMTQLEKIHKHFTVYFRAPIFLHVAYKTMQGSLKDEMLDVLLIILLYPQFNDARRCLSARQSSVLSLKIACMLMKVVANNSRSTLQLIKIELSKAYLYRALRCKDSDSDSVYCLVNVYLAVLCYIKGQYQTAIDHCTLVTRSRDHSQCTSRVVQGDLLPIIDDDVDNTLGLVALYAHIRAAVLNEDQLGRHSTVFTTEFFACYLHVRCLSVTKCRQDTEMSLTDEVQRYENCVCKLPEMFITDLLLFSFSCRTKYPPYDRPMTTYISHSKQSVSHQLLTSELVELLEQSAVEHMTMFRQLQAQEFGSVVEIVTTDFEALYAYKRGEYQRCLQLSTHNVRMLIVTGDRVSVPCWYVELIQFVDDDIVSLVGFLMIVFPSWREDYEPDQISIHQLSVSLYLMIQCQMRLHQSVTSLAQTLDYVKFAHSKLDQYYILDQAMLMLLKHKILKYMASNSDDVNTLTRNTV